VERIGVKTTSSTIIMTTATVRCPISDPSPNPTTNPMVASNSSHSPLLIMSEFARRAA
jgi:hypothetical protein